LIFVIAGEVRVEPAPAKLTTVLGSCVAVTLWCADAGIGGINHYLLPRSADGKRSAQYGDIAIDALVDAMISAGARPARMVAKVFGGAVSGQYRWHVGPENVLVAWEHLARTKIPVVAADVGGRRGRRVTLDTQSGVAQVRYLE
jgi:chemotaxis protein CheD